MDKLKEIFSTLWSKIVDALKSFENSSAFEHTMRKYEGLTPSQQTTLKGITKLSFIVVVALMILGGPFYLLSQLKEIHQLEELEADAMSFQAEYEAQTKGFTPPTGWKPLASSSADELAAAFNEYLPGIGVPEQFGTLVANGDTLNLTLREISIRQATNIIFQLEGLYPKVKAQTLKMRPNAGQREILDLEATFKFNPAFANQISADIPSSDDNLEGDPTSDFIRNNPPPGNNPSNTNSGNSFNNEGGNDYIPPPPNVDTDFDELAPPEIQDELPPPPPPPGFEEEL